MFNQRKDLVPIARVIKSNGADGEVVFSLKDLNPAEVNDKEPVFILFDGSPVPFFIESLTPRGERKALVRLQGVKSGEDVGEIIGKDVFAEAASLPEVEYEDDGSFLVGWTLYDGNIKIGEITDFIDIPNNPCIEVSTKNGAAMIPLHENLIASINEDSRSLVMDIPSGLI